MSNQFFTQADSFGSTSQTCVDPRTGLFMANIKLASLQANNGAGPLLDLALSYVPVSISNLGWGIGVSLGLTCYDKNQKLLTLQTGESCKIEESGSSLAISQKKLDSFHFVKIDNGYQISYKSGVVEHLSAFGDNLYLPDSIYSPDGHRLSLAWISNGASARLQTISDQNGVLCQFSYQEEIGVNINIWPATTEAQSLYLALKNNYIGSLTQSSVSPALVWECGYVNIDNVWFMTSLSSPTGLIQSVNYTAGLMQFPSQAGAVALPAVNKAWLTPGMNQPVMTTSYSYSPENYLGFDADFSAAWNPDIDNLYNALGSYAYSSTATLESASGTPEITTRTYNSYHLQTREVVQRGDCSRTTDTTYYATEGSFDDQPLQFQCQKSSAVTFYDASRPAVPAQLTQTAFDEYGNPSQKIRPDGLQIDWMYYPAAGVADLCPPEPNGFVRYARQVTITPAPSVYAAPVQSVSYQYQALPAVAGAPVASVVLPTEKDFTSDGLRRMTQTTAYIDDPAALDHAAVSQRSQTLYTEDGQPSTSVVDLSRKVDDEGLTTTSVLTGFDQLQFSSWRTQSRYSGRLLAWADTEGVETALTYDAIGRLISRTHNPATPYANVTTQSYAQTFSSTGSVSSRTLTSVDALGNVTCNALDGLGRLLSQSRSATPGPDAPLYQTRLNAYNDLGQRISETDQDYLLTSNAGSATPDISTVNTLHYDLWGQHNQTSLNDQQIEIAQFDPVDLSQTRQTRSATGTEVSGTSVKVFDPKLLQIVTSVADAKGVQQWVSTHALDGLGRLRQAMDEIGQPTLYEYDAFHRVVKTTYADGSALCKDYAASSVRADVAAISVLTPAGQTIALGTQDFDSLSRVTRSENGGRVWLYSYTGAGPDATAITTPKGDVIQSGFVPQLNDMPNHISVNDIALSFDYDPVTAAMTRASVAGGVVQTRAYTPAGLLQTETSTPATGTARTASWAYSLLGRLQHCEDVTGLQQISSYDPAGRRVQIDDAAVLINLTYDAPGRYTGYTSTDKATQHSMQLVLTLDDFNREIGRDYFADGATSALLSIQQTWQPNSALQQRDTWQSGQLLRSEIYTYDLRNRLINYTCSGSALPTDAYGKLIQQQQFSYDALSNITQCITVFNGGSDRADFHFSNAADPCQLSAISHTHADYPALVSLVYDASGGLVQDEAQRTLTYDALGRLQTVQQSDAAASYEYDGLSNVVAQNLGSDDRRELFYRSNVLVNEILLNSQQQKRFVALNDNSVATSTLPL